MILPDTNLLIYATNAALPQHAAAKEWWDECLNGTEGIGLAWQVVLPYIRVLSSAQLLAETILRINRADSVSSLFVD